VLLLFAISLVIIFGQFATPANSTDNFYFQLVNEGNRNLYDGNLEIALQKYLDAFQTENHHFLHDLQKAIIISHKLQRFDVKKALLKKIASDKNIDTYTFLNKFTTPDFFSNQDLEIISLFRNKNEEKLNALCSIYYSVRRIQLAKSNASYRYEHENFLDTMSWDPYVDYRDSIYNELASELIKFCKINGPPTEGNLGQSTFCTVDNDLDLHTITMIQNILRTIWRTDKREEISQLLKKETMTGNYHPSSYALNMEFTYEGKDSKKSYDSSIEYLNTTVWVIMGKYYIPFITYSDSLMNAIDQRRNDIGLDSFKYAQRQVMCFRLCRDSLTTTPFMSIYPYTRFDEMGLGFVKYALESEGLNVDEQLRYHRINTARIQKECSCDNLTY
jgi:hypothetical protein